jgi:predicted peptidase
MNYAKEKYGIDRSRLYLIGFSEGGTSTCDFAATYPEQLAALVAMVGVSKSGDLESKSKNIVNNDLPFGCCIMTRISSWT